MNTQHAPAQIIAKYIIEATLGTDPIKNQRWPTFIGFMPNERENKSGLICCYDTNGTTDGRLMRTGTIIEHPSVQIRLRSVDAQSAYAKARSIATALDSLFREEISLEDSTYLLLNASRRSPILDMGTSPEEKTFKNFSINYLLTIKEN